MKQCIKTYCSPRASVLEKKRRDIVLELSELLQNTISPDQFFSENFVTSGMRELLERAFATLTGVGSTENSTIILSQSMGGGKTHNMISLGLLARYPEFRKRVLGKDVSLKPVRVIGFTGRDSTAEFGIWGELAGQLDKRDFLKHCYSPLKAPGMKDWINLLRGEPVLILLDELPPYFEHAKTQAVGSGNLADITTTALANLLVAVNKPELANVCVVLSDLNATSYKDGSDYINKALEYLKRETDRSTVRIEPVRSQGDEFYQILRTRLFECIPDNAQIEEVCQNYAEAVRLAHEAGLTNEVPQDVVTKLRESYPFHYSLRDLYARFKENANFQQTRGLIRLMRMVVANLYQSKKAEKLLLIHPYDIDLNDKNIFSEIKLINPSLEEAIAHDIADNGASIAEKLDREQQTDEDSQELLKLLLISSLSTANNPIVGLKKPEIVGIMTRPGRNLTRLNDLVFKELLTQTWYLHLGSEGRYFFQRTQNITAKLRDYAQGYGKEQCYKEIRTLLTQFFLPTQKNCYQVVACLKAPDEESLDIEKTILFIVEPSSSPSHKQKLSSDWQQFYDAQEFKNRALFLSGSNTTLQHVRELAAQYAAIRAIIAEDGLDKLSDADPRRIEAATHEERIFFRLRQAIKEAFHLLLYPSKEGLTEIPFSFQFEDNKFSGEQEIRSCLLKKQKFTETFDDDTFRQKSEQRLFGDQKRRNWSEVRRRAASNPHWPLHPISALETLKTICINKRLWVQEGDYVNIAPPPPEATARVQLSYRDPSTGEATLKVQYEHGDVVYYEEGDVTPNTRSSKVGERPGGYAAFKTRALKVSFLCVDSTKRNPSSKPTIWCNPITLDARFKHTTDGILIELEAIPGGQIRYTLDGTDPRSKGLEYTGPILLEKEHKILAAIASTNDLSSEVKKIDLSVHRGGFKIDPQQSYKWQPKKNCSMGRQTAYQWIGQLKKYEGKVSNICFDLSCDDEVHTLSYSKNHGLKASSNEIEDTLTKLRTILPNTPLELSNLSFDSVYLQGIKLQQWCKELDIAPSPEEISIWVD